jgi:hypothetical protein
MTWFRQFDASPSFNPERIYMYNRNIGFMSRQQYFYKTTNSGRTGLLYRGTSNGAFLDIYFINRLNRVEMYLHLLRI